MEIRDRVLYVYDLLCNSPDGLSIQDIINEIYEDFGVIVFKDTIYKDIEAIELHLPMVTRKKGKTIYWKVKK
jgi:hypothetical protein